jgi:cysteine synthase A
MIYKNPFDLVFGDIFLEVPELIRHGKLFLKLEGLSLTGSIKIKPALHMLNRMELEGLLKPGMSVIESSSGNLGLALAMACAVKRYPFICVTDPNVSPQTVKLIQVYGAKLVTVQHRDKNGGFLGSRIELIQSMIKDDPQLVWTNQYENLHNVEAHYFSTGPEILRQFPRLDYVFIGAGTTGTLGGVSRYLRQHSPETKIIAVDSIGSVTFGFPAGKRHIPGLGTSHPPAIRSYADYDEILMVDERLAVEMCCRQARRGLFLGGSSGTVLAGVVQMAHQIAPEDCVVAVSPDMGDRYIDTIYDPHWVEQRFPDLDASLPTSHTATALAHATI